MKTPLWVLFLILSALTAHACIWDAETLFQEKLRNHDLAKAILGGPAQPENPQSLQDRIKKLETNRDENNPDWWNNLAGAYLRLNQPATAVKLLEPVVSRFTNDYGIHANLGTAYHLMGRYQDAEKEIARDLEINPAAHFGLEKYHFALLQYLIRDSNYQSRHVYVDEFTYPMLSTDSTWGRLRRFVPETNFLDRVQDLETNYQEWINLKDYRRAGEILGEISLYDAAPEYRAKWNLANDTNFEAGVIYMAEMNPKEPACFEMLGVAAWAKRDYHLAATAFEKAIALGSPQKDLLQMKISGLKSYISHSSVLGDQFSAFIAFFLIVILIPVLLIYYFYAKHRDYKRKVKLKA